jgi:hypothetical protein
MIRLTAFLIWDPSWRISSTETSTDPRIVTIAAETSVGLQWPLGLDLEPPMTRLHDTFELCFSPSPGGWEGRPGMAHCAIQCGRAYCSLRVVDPVITLLLSAISP